MHFVGHNGVRWPIQREDVLMYERDNYAGTPLSGYSIILLLLYAIAVSHGKSLLLLCNTTIAYNWVVWSVRETSGRMDYILDNNLWSNFFLYYCL